MIAWLEHTSSVRDRRLVGSPGANQVRGCAWPYQKRRWESNPLEAALQAAAVPSGSSATLFSALARSRTWSSTFAGSRAIRNTPRTCSRSVPRRGIEPRPAVSRTAMLVRHTRRAFIASVSTRTRTWIWTFGGSYAIPCTIETFSIPTWSRTRSKALGKPYAFRYTIGTKTNQGRRLDSHQHGAVYKTAAFLNRATSASRSARI